MGVVDLRQLAKHLLFAVIMGVVGAAVSAVVVFGLTAIFDFYVEHRWLVVLLPVLGLVSLWLYHRANLPLNLTTGQVVDDIRNNKQTSPYLAPGIYFGTNMCQLGGASIGDEGTAVLQMGASIGNLVGRMIKLKPVFRTDDPITVNGFSASCGMAAAFSSLFFCPIGATLFVLEMLRYKRSLFKHGVALLIASFVSYGIALWIGIGDFIPAVPIPDLAWSVLGQAIIVGAACGVVGSVTSNLVRWLQKTTSRISQNYYLWVVIGGIIIAVLTLLFGWEDYGGSGYHMLAPTLAGQEPDYGFLIKILLTIIALCTWFKGGEVTPSMAIGCLLGAACTVMSGAEVGFSAALGLFAFLATVTRCPLAAIVMGCEIFGIGMAPYLIVSVFFSFAASSDIGFYGKSALSEFVEVVREQREQRQDLKRNDQENHEPVSPENSTLRDDLDHAVEKGHEAVVRLEKDIQHSEDTVQAFSNSYHNRFKGGKGSS